MRARTQPPRPMAPCPFATHSAPRRPRSPAATIFAGVALAGIIMTILTVAGKAGALVALAALCAFGGGAILSAAKKEGSSDESSE